MGKILRLIEEKKRISAKLSELLSRESIERAERDHHSKRMPRPCGITIHTGIGCSYVCSYCYIYDMGLPVKVEPYPLEPLEMVYSLSINPYVIPQKTFVAYGSVTEPFLPKTKNLALAYIENVYKWLSLPSQVSTKCVIDEALARGLKHAEPCISILVTLTTIGKSKILETRAPEPMNRLNGVAVASRAGLSVYLFIRPIIPGVTDKEIDKIIELGVEHRIRGVVCGSLRVTQQILHRLKNKGIDISEITMRLPKTPKTMSQQISIKVDDIVSIIEKKARDYGAKFFRTACMANVDSHNDYCFMCSLGPCGNSRKRYDVNHNDIAEYLDFIGLKYKCIDIRNDHIIVEGLRGSTKVFAIAKLTISYTSRTMVKMVPMN
ncbi:MAG: radical SAM protein [Ignisphaera sp.]|uniref:Radical SAM protein n=1 Tax=Ignisphaera aggregans TaxID=334771 RepID=A0A7J3MWG2_9CREN